MKYAALSAVLALTSCKVRDDAASAVKDAPSHAADLSTYACPASEKIRVAFFDADSTLRVAKSGAVSANAADDVDVLPFVGSKIGELNKAGYLVAIVSNQMGIQQGKITAEASEAALSLTARGLGELGGRIDYIGMAPADDDLRKPKTGLASQLAGLLKDKCGKEIDLANSLMVGDSAYKRGVDGPSPDGRPADDFSNADRLFAKNLFAPDGELDDQHFQEPTDYFGWKAYGVYNIESPGQLEDFLLTLEAKAKAGEPGTDSAALLREVETVRRVNGMTKRAIRFAHFNVKELRTDKLVNMQDAQVERAALNIRLLNPDLVSINEIQYDLPDVATVGLPGTGDNMKRFVARTHLDATGWSYNLAQANTGNLSKKQPDGNYAINPNAPGADQLADQVNFGTFPGQYSTGFATRFPVTKATVLTDLKWRDWDQAFKFADFKLPNGQPLPDDMSLFDKNFNDVLVELAGRPAHVVTFHTVPAFGFGGSADANVQRNLAQLAFLEWYLLGSCDAADASSAVKRCETEAKPLEGNTPFIAIGDLNVDWGTTAGGAAVIKRLLENPKVNNWRAENHDWMFRADPTDKRAHISYMSDGVDLGKIQSELDYFIVSKQFKIEDGRVFAPLSYYQEHSCHDTKAKADAAKTPLTLVDGRDISVSTRYADDGTKTFCVVSVTKSFAAFRKGSDHLPVYVTLSWAD